MNSGFTSSAREGLLPRFEPTTRTSSSSSGPLSIKAFVTLFARFVARASTELTPHIESRSLLLGAAGKAAALRYMHMLMLYVPVVGLKATGNSEDRLVSNSTR